MPTETFFRLPDERRQRVIDAALDEFAEYTYGEASISRIVARAGIAKGSFYQYFASKVDLFEWLAFEELGRQKIAFLQRQPPPPAGSDFFATVEGMAFAGLKWALLHPKLARIAEALSRPTADPELGAIVARGQRVGYAAMVALLEAGQQAGQVRRDLDLGIAAAVLTATLQQGANRALEERFGFDIIGLMQHPDRARAIGDEPLRALVASVVDLLRRGLGCAGGQWSVERIDIAKISDESLRGKR